MRNPCDGEVCDARGIARELKQELAEVETDLADGVLRRRGSGALAVGKGTLDRFRYPPLVGGRRSATARAVAGVWPPIDKRRPTGSAIRLPERINRRRGTCHLPSR